LYFISPDQVYYVFIANRSAEYIDAISGYAYCVCGKYDFVGACASTLTCPDCGYGKTETMPTALRKNYVKNVLPCPGPWLDNG